LAAIIALVLTVTTSHAAPDIGAAWDWQLSGHFKPLSGIAVFDTDPDNVTKAQITGLKRAGIYTICYISVGTLENYRDDVADFPAHVVGKTYGDWPDEKFLDVRDLKTLLPLMKKRFKTCKSMGFDAIEPDNMDVFTNDSGFNIKAAQNVRYIKALAKMAHGMGLQIGQKNVPELTSKLIDTLDFVITEDCYVDHWCNQVGAYIKAGKPVFAAEYTDTRVNFKKACKATETQGFSLILKDRDLGAGGRRCN
jgi:hypothetical protein